MILDRYRLIKNLGSGGMGEVFVVDDTRCQRIVALKRIRKNLEKIPSIRKRFLKEAHIAAKLNHPSILPIFSIYNEKDQVYYTMPYIEGKTLKQILRETRKFDQKTAIPSGIRIFLNICQAVAYCHSKRILHRDLKPENVIVGKFGEVLILDWGLAEYIGQTNQDVEQPIDLSIPDTPDLTIPGKVVGTLAYLAPERAQDEQASEQTDLYALGVILYQILTLTLPFKRTDLESLKKTWSYEEFIEPIEAAPYRDIPHGLNEITKKCLEPSRKLRYQHVSELVADLEGFVEGKPDWIFIREFKIDRKEEWEFQENILLTKHIAITRFTEVMEWVNLMISKEAFPGNIKIEAQVQLGTQSHGIGFLLNVPERNKRKSLMDGYCVWIGSTLFPGGRLFHRNIEVIESSNVVLEAGVWYKICIEKIESYLTLFINDILTIHYVSHTPLSGTQIGLLLRDADLNLLNMTLFSGSQNVKVSCLAIPDAFLANREYAKAFSEYNKIALSFPGRREGREAIFRSGITLLESGLVQTGAKKRIDFFSLALEKFGELRTTAGAPLEYLGKSLVYKALGEVEEEAKCLELAIRKYEKHPLFSRLVEHIVFRLHEASSYDRIAAYHFALLTLRHLFQIFVNPENRKLIDSMRKNWEMVPLFHPEAVMVYLAFFLAKPLTLLELIESNSWVEESFYALLVLGCFKMIKKNRRLAEFPFIEEALLAHKKGISAALKQGNQPPKLLYYLVQQALDEGIIKEVFPLIENRLFEERSKDLKNQNLESTDANSLVYLGISALLFTDRLKEAGAIFETFPLEQLCQETGSLFHLFGCYLWATEGEKIARAHFNTVSETPYPHIASLISHFLSGKIDLKKGWIKKALLWEKMQLYRQLILFYHCSNQPSKVAVFFKKLRKLKKFTPHT